MNPISKYFDWLQQGNPTGAPTSFPELAPNYETSVKGIYCIGDLTGIPLIKLAAESGVSIINTLNEDRSFTPGSIDEYDLIICGAGPAGISATIEATKRGWNVLCLESATEFNTIKNYPAKKPIVVTPADTPSTSQLPFSDGTKESLLEELQSSIAFHDLPITSGVNVDSIKETKNGFTVNAGKKTFTTQRVVIAIGSSGNARQLNVPGENLPKVLNQLIDPAVFSGKNICVVGGGDSALESAVALAESGNSVVLSYRKPELARPKESNRIAFEKLVAEKKITPYFNSTVNTITESEITLNTVDGEQTLANDHVFTMIGREIPIAFFKRSHIKMEGERSVTWWIQLVTMLLFFSMLYFGKAGHAFDLINENNSTIQNITNYLTAPSHGLLNWGADGYQWYSSLNFLLGWGSSLLFILFGTISLGIFMRKWRSFTGSLWGKIKYGYIVGASIFFTTVYFSSLLGQNGGWVEEPTYWYSLLYCTTMLLFGVRRMIVKPTRYVYLQTSTLILIQVIFLFLLPFHIYEPFIADKLSAESWIITELFPQGKWSSFGFILFWPLNMANFGTSTFWTWFPMIQTFVILPILIYLGGKGAYCGWICSCGGMAETLGDEYRGKALHGPQAKRWENIGQLVLLCAVIATVLHEITGGIIGDSAWGAYKFIVDVIFAGILGLGVYFFLSGRFWCRFLCPLAALMHIYNKFSRYRIVSDKDHCISCNICTKSCHMGIDVMNYANKGTPLDDVQCVACSTCITDCPMDVLKFGRK